jgi:hypothetical protein
MLTRGGMRIHNSRTTYDSTRGGASDRGHGRGQSPEARMSLIHEPILSANWQIRQIIIHLSLFPRPGQVCSVSPPAGSLPPRNIPLKTQLPRGSGARRCARRERHKGWQPAIPTTTRAPESSGPVRNLLSRRPTLQLRPNASPYQHRTRRALNSAPNHPPRRWGRVGDYCACQPSKIAFTPSVFHGAALLSSACSTRLPCCLPFSANVGFRDVMSTVSLSGPYR